MIARQPFGPGLYDIRNDGKNADLYSVQFSGTYMKVITGVGMDEAGTEFYVLHRERPATILHEGTAYRAKNGRVFQTGILVVNGQGRGVAWPVQV